MRLWYLSHRRPAKAQARAFTVRTHEVRKYMNGPTKHLKSSPYWMAAHARLKNEFTDDEKYHNLMSWLKFCGGHR